MTGTPGNCRNETMLKMATYAMKNVTTPVEEFWERRVLGISDGITSFGEMRWELFFLLFLAWVLVYLVIYKGLHQSGKIIWFTALFPYLILFVLLGRAVTLDGALNGMKYFITPKWEKLLTAMPWIDGSTQIFFAYSIGIGTLPALGSYNKFNHNCHRDAIITCVVNTFTCLLAGCLTFSILGYLADIQGLEIDDVVESGPGLVFITYPEVVLKLQGAAVWAIIFFIMLAILGVDSEFCNVESFITGVVDNWASVIRPHRMKFAFSVCFVMFLCGIPMVFEGGPYLFQLMDFYSASGLSLLWVCFFQTVAISWIFGVDRVNQCIYEMMGIKPNKFWNITWKYLTPFIMVAIFLFFCIQYEPVKYANTYEYPWWGQVIGFLVSASSMIWIPGYAIYFLIKTPGTFKERLQKGLTPKFSKLQKRTVIPPENSPPMPMSDSQAVLINTP
ncbi:UNVERIFIED_CONTAM: hypothetical protein PYX00_005746 [Menopon gallinae]|uniref:Sodium-and chloride-dependent GABA transporter 2 n=1 Tax=Menopon gallinae TaxID=328185 RepID=A0AAW2HSV2_9NEOP